MNTAARANGRREQILAVAADLSTTVGLHSLSFSQVATQVGLSKAGVAAHFDSKQALQLAVVESVADTYRQALSQVARDAEPGLPRLKSLASGWFDHLANIPYSGGCFFAAAGAAFAGIEGPVRDRIALHTNNLIALMEEQARLGLRLGEFKAGTDPDNLVFQIHALAAEANLRRELLQQADAFAQAQRALADLFAQVSKRDHNNEPDEG